MTDKRVNVVMEHVLLTYSIAATYSEKKWRAKAKFASYEPSARIVLSPRAVMEAHLKHGQSVPAGMVDESVFPIHLGAFGLIETELDYDRC